MTQQDMFGHEARRKAPDTQIEGLERSRENLNERQAQVMRLVDGAGERGITLFEACAFYGVPPNRLSGRFTELAEQGRIVDSGNRRVNPVTGVRAVVWIKKISLDSK